MLKYFKFNHTLRWLSANTSMHMQTNNVKDRGVPGKGGRRFILPPLHARGQLQCNTHCFPLTTYLSLSPSISLTLFFSLSLSLYPPASFSVSLLYAPRAASVDHALTAIKAAIFIAPV